MHRYRTITAQDADLFDLRLNKAAAEGYAVVSMAVTNAGGFTIMMAIMERHADAEQLAAIRAKIMSNRAKIMSNLDAMGAESDALDYGGLR